MASKSLPGGLFVEFSLEKSRALHAHFGVTIEEFPLACSPSAHRMDRHRTRPRHRPIRLWPYTPWFGRLPYHFKRKSCMGIRLHDLYLPYAAFLPVSRFTGRSLALEGAVGILEEQGYDRGLSLFVVVMVPTFGSDARAERLDEHRAFSARTAHGSVASNRAILVLICPLPLSPCSLRDESSPLVADAFSRYGIFCGSPDRQGRGICWAMDWGSRTVAGLLYHGDTSLQTALVMEARPQSCVRLRDLHCTELRRALASLSHAVPRRRRFHPILACHCGRGFVDNQREPPAGPHHRHPGELDRTTRTRVDDYLHFSCVSR